MTKIQNKMSNRAIGWWPLCLPYRWEPRSGDELPWLPSVSQHCPVSQASVRNIRFFYHFEAEVLVEPDVLSFERLKIAWQTFFIYSCQHWPEQLTGLASSLKLRVYTDGLQEPMLERDQSPVHCVYILAKAPHSEPSVSPNAKNLGEWNGTQQSPQCKGVVVGWQPHGDSLKILRCGIHFTISDAGKDG